MKRLFLLMALFTSLDAGAQPFKAMTYNIRYDNPDDGDNRWELRSEGMIGLVRKADADIIGFQEVLHGQLLDLEKGLKGFEHYGVGRDDGMEEGEYAPLFVKTRRFKMMENGNFWLSQSPEVPGKGWDAACNRICTWAMLKDNSSKKNLLVMNTHLDHAGKKARENSVRLLLDFILRKTEEYAEGLEEGAESGLEIILLGDFNFSPDNSNYQLLSNSGTAGNEGLSDAFLASPAQSDGPSGTYNGFKTEDVPTERIDFIWTSGIEIRSCRHIGTKLADGRWPSDHIPVIAEMEHAD